MRSNKQLPPNLGSQYDLRSLIHRRSQGGSSIGQTHLFSSSLPTYVQQPRLNRHLGHFMAQERASGPQAIQEEEVGCPPALQAAG